MSQFDNVSVLKQANVYFDGKCISHTVLLPDGSRKTLGVLLPSTLTFNTGAPEVMEITGGHCRVRLAGQTDWIGYSEGQSFAIPADSSFEIETTDLVNYVCHFG